MISRCVRRQRRCRVIWQPRESVYGQFSAEQAVTLLTRHLLQLRSRERPVLLMFFNGVSLIHVELLLTRSRLSFWIILLWHPPARTKLFADLLFSKVTHQRQEQEPGQLSMAQGE